MTHYICTGSCGMESRSAGVCESEFCSKEGKTLVECNCEDGHHEAVGSKPDEETTTEVMDDEI